jgi:acetyltransferase
MHGMAADIRLSETRLRKERRMAFSSNPGELETTISIADGRIFQLRPTRSEDIDALRKLFTELSHNEIRMRFLHAMYKVPDRQVTDFFRMDDYWGMSFVLVGMGQYDEREIFGYVQIIPDPDKERGEFAILVHSNLTRMGIGRALLEHIMSYARKKGLREIYGHSLVENVAMLKLATALRFSFADTGDPESVMMTMRL